MASCPQCGVTVSATQRLCRACGCDLARARSSGGLFARLRRWLARAGRLSAGLPRISVSVNVEREDQEEDHWDAANPATLPPQVREALAKAHQEAPADGGAGVKVRSVGPVQITTKTVTHTYHSLNEMPPELRQRAEAALRDRAPASTDITLVINGERRVYRRIEDVPEPYRQAVAVARQKAGQD